MPKKRTVRKGTRRSTPDSKSIVKRIQKVGEREAFLAVLLYGKAGSGKTHVSATFPGPILIINIREDGTDTILGIPDIDEIRMESWSDLDNIFWHLKDGSKYKTIVFDQITNMQDLGMEEVRLRSNKSPKDLFTRKNWGELSGMMKTQLQSFRDLKEEAHLVFIGHQRTFEGGDEEDEALDPTVGVRLMPSVGDYLEGAVDVIGSTFVRESFTREKNEKARTRRVEYCMRIGPHGYYVTKIRRPVAAGPIPELLINPTYQKLKDIISGKKVMKKKSKATKTRRKSQ